ncbi:MAG: hypothetical protein IJM17_04610 [Firmicutes bacterium]|nr:hypothetical protein [Bacillota bacterium]
MSGQISLYKCILNGMKDGRLEEGFSLPPEEGSELRFADGARDGIVRYHMLPEKLDEAGAKLMAGAVRYAAKGNARKADKAFSELGKVRRAVGMIGELQRFIMDRRDRLNADNLYRTALELMIGSCGRETVKFALIMMALFVPDSERTKEVIRTLGLSDEFTLFSVLNMLGWEGGNAEIFALAQKVRGWGRIHALDLLKPETSDIREWILLNGVDNDVMPAYSALTAWEKADVAERLYGPLTKEEFAAIGRIMEALLDEGPVAGISEIEDAEEYVLKYLSLAGSYKLGPEELAVLDTLKNWLEAPEDPEEERSSREE